MKLNKYCCKCKQIKGINQFNKNKHAYDNTDTYCRSCRTKYNDKYREKNKKYYHEYFRNYNFSPSFKKWAKKNKKKRSSQRKLENSLFRHNATKPDKCSKCKNKIKPSNLHGHHEDYNKPLKVLWLCQKCHKKVHKLKRNLIEKGAAYQVV